MRFWSLCVLLLLAYAVNAQQQQAGPEKDEYADLLDFSREDNSKYKEDYSNEHDEYELKHDRPDPRKIDISSLLVCGPSKADRCECEKNTGRIDCRKDTREKNAKSFEIVALQSAAIRVKLDKFIPKYVYLTGNQISSISQQTLIPEMQGTVNGLDLSFNDIEFIREGTFDEFTNLTKLRLNQNWIKINDNTDGWITEKLGKTLKSLNLAYNSITKLHDGAFDELHNLEKLILDGNTGLILSNTTFQKDGLVNLTALSLDNCGLTNENLPDDAFKNLPKLKYLSLIQNDFISIPAALKPIPLLQTLDLSESTKMKQWKANSMDGFSGLLKLFLRKMEIQSYGNCAFCGLTSLQYIDLSDSPRLVRLEPNAFGVVKNSKESPTGLKKIKMENCKIASLDKVMLDWDKLDEIAIGGNPWNCDYNLDWLIEDKKLHLFVGTSVPTCASPPTRAGVPLQKVVEQAGNSSGVGSFFRNVLYMGITIGILGIVLTGVLVVSKRYDTRHIISNLFSRQQPGGAGGFSNLNANVSMEDDERVFDDDDNEFQPRPAAV